MSGRVATKRMPDGTLVHVTLHGERKPHRHKFDTNAERTYRKCAACNLEQVKVRNRWKDKGNGEAE